MLPGGGGDKAHVAANLPIGKLIFDEVIKLNDAGQFYPMWGICLGYEFLIDYTTDKNWEDVFGSYFIDSESLELEFPISPEQTKFYKGFGDDAYDFTSKNLTYNSHDWALNPDRIKSDKRLSDFWNLTAISHMPKNASVEFP